MIYNNEKYKEIPNFSGYFINKETAKVLSTKEGRNCHKGQIKTLNPVINSKGYYQYYMIDNDGNKKSPMQHQLLMRTFVDNKENHPSINHIDGNKLNNSLENLEWCTNKHNIQHAISTELLTYEFCEVPIHQYSLSGEYIKTFKSIAEASRETGSSSANIVYSAKKTIEQTKGFMYSYEKFKYLPPYSGNPVTKSIKVTDLKTKDEYIFTKLVEVTKFTNIHRSKFMRRFKKSNDFTIEHYYIERTTF